MPEKQEEKTVIYYPPPDERRCTAKSKQSGHRCRRWAAKGSKVCHYHGARSSGPRTPEGLERSRSARLIHGQSAAEALKLRMLRKVLLAAAVEYSLLQNFPAYVAANIKSMDAHRFRGVRKSMASFCKGDISVLELITRLDGKKPSPVMYSEQDKYFASKINECIAAFERFSNSTF
jgi:hypothetical protein